MPDDKGPESLAPTQAQMHTSNMHSSHLFTVRLWAEELDESRAEWRGKVQHVISGEAHYFREWSKLADCILAMLPALRMEAIQQPYPTGDGVSPDGKSPRES